MKVRHYVSKAALLHVLFKRNCRLKCEFLDKHIRRVESDFIGNPDKIMNKISFNFRNVKGEGMKN